MVEKRSPNLETMVRRDDGRTCMQSDAGHGEEL